MISATSIASSISPQGIRIDTLKLRYPWMIHGELMTHRVFSRNASSNRAVPLAKMLEEARSDDLRAEPVFWGAEQKGMEPGGELSRYDPAGVHKDIDNPWSPHYQARKAWRTSAMEAARQAEELGRLGTHKSLCNRLLMPFTHANVVVTATEWDNFFGLRLASDADPTMRALAEAMRRAYNEATPVPLQPGEWHLPFVDNEEVFFDDTVEQAHANRIKVSVARCARVSYETFETGKRSTVEADLRLYDQLLKNGHWSPFEHQATPDIIVNGKWAQPELHGNLQGMLQYRKMHPGENCKVLPDAYKTSSRI